jgi:hypothetical protein
MAKPARPELIFRSIDDLLADADRLRSGPYDKAGQWDLPMILDHLAKAMTLPASTTVPAPVAIVARYFIHRMARHDFYPPFTFPSAKSMLPTPSISLESAEPAFRSAAEKIKTLNGQWVTGTPFGPLPRADFIKLHLLHGAHHLSFLSPRA